MTKPLHTVALTAGFLADAKDEGMTAAEVSALEQLLAAHPDAGEMIVGSGGCRKVRLAGKGKGKSGGYRVVTFFAVADLPVYALAVLAKNSRANFDKAEIADLAELAKAILAAHRGRKG